MMMLFNNKFLAIPVLSLLLLSACKLGTDSSISELIPKRLSMSASPAKIAAHPDRIVASKKLTGHLRELIWGDYFYAKISTQTGENILFFIDENQDCFLREHQQIRLAIEYDVVERYLPQPQRYHQVNIIRAIATNRTNLARWQRSLTTEQLEKCRENYR